MSRRRKGGFLGLPTREETRTFYPPVSALLAHYLVTLPRRLPEDYQTRLELQNFIHELRAQLQHLGVYAEPGEPK